MSTHYTENITLYGGVPFDNSYQYTLNPYPVATKLVWFNREFPNAFTSNNIMHIKLNTVTGTGTVRLEVPDDKISTFNYAYIDNKKGVPYFAFVLGFQYINDGHNPGSSVYEISIQKDVLMTHLTDPDHLREASIIRHHSGQNKFNNPWCAEPFAGGTVRNKDYERVNIETCQSYQIIQYVTSEDDTDFITSNSECVVDRQACATAMIFAGQFDRGAITNTVKDLARKAENVAAVYNAPRCLFTTGPADGGSYLTEDDTIKSPIIVYPDLHYNNFTGIPLKNHKCYYYPYNFLRVYNDAGQYMDLRYEYWEGNDSLGKCLAIEGNLLPPVSLTIAPVGYNKANGSISGDGIGTSWEYQSTHKLTMGNYPIGSWVNDTYSQAVGAGKIIDGMSLSRPTELLRFASNKLQGSSFSSVGNAYDANYFHTYEGKGSDKKATGFYYTEGYSPGPALTGVTSAATDLAYASIAAELAADSVGGSLGSGNTEFAHNHKYFYTSHMCLSTEDFLALDSLFDRFGYAQGGFVSKPDPFARPLWCYIQTAGDTFQPNSSDSQSMCNTLECNIINNAFRNGITFWNGNNTSAEIGTFDRENGGSAYDIDEP